MSPAQRFFEHENLERLNAERELTADKRSIRSQVARAKQLQILWQQGLRSAAYHRRVSVTAPPFRNKVVWLDDHTLAVRTRQRCPPRRRLVATGRIVDIDKFVRCCQQEIGASLAGENQSRTAVFSSVR